MKYCFKITALIVSIILLIPFIGEAQNLLKNPQKIAIDSKRNRLLVSNGGSGNIVQIDSSGKQSYFVQGANFWDGMEIVGDTIYGAGKSGDLRAYDLVTRQNVMNIPFTGSSANYLSSIVSDSAGHLFISCPRLNIIYKMNISDHSFWIFTKDHGLLFPNGILLEKEKNRIVVIDDSPSPSKIHAISLTDSTAVTTLATTTLTQPDGIVRDNKGWYYIGGYYLPGIYRVDSNFSQPPSLYHPGSHFVYPTYDEVNNSLLLTLYNANSWERFSLNTSALEPKTLEKGYFLKQNYPNPFNPSTVIQYQLPFQSRVRIIVSNGLGNIVSVLIDEIKNAGIHECRFNAETLSSGIYYYQIFAGNFIETKKMILLR